MPQVGWVYIAPSGKHYRVGLYHGAGSGHLLIHINGMISKIEFHVEKTKTYSLYIEDQWIHIDMFLEEGKWSYTFREDREVRTPANDRRRREEWNNLIIFVLILAILIAMIIFVVTIIV